MLPLKDLVPGLLVHLVVHTDDHIHILFSDIIGLAFDKTSKERKGLSRDHIKQLSGMLDRNTVKMIQEETLEFIKTNMNHLPMYYIPGQEFP